MKRQPLYACITCCPESSETTGGICLGCSYHCHEGHELVELYTKRFFRCDCGTSKFPSTSPCKLMKDKSVNTENSYNQNFQGKYCTCGRPYPDAEDSVVDSMIQCIICEDWYHGRHTKTEPLPSDEEFSEMICQSCVPKLTFIKNYLKLAVTPAKENEPVDVEATSPRSREGAADGESASVSKAEKSEAPAKAAGTAEGACKLKEVAEQTVPTGSLFFAEGWRKDMCTCSDCKKLYERLGVSFLTDPEDTVAFYESEGRAKRQASRLDRITRTEVVHEYNNLSTSLREYLRKFAENGKVVKDDDIREFFSELSANKKQKKDGMQYFCK
ncbi:UNVERIFIED_CONTAM: hypothetical protein GTU68_026124 [Idotea baltica]|nr:hypothetical protein [Idotea baltica]